MAPLKPRGSYRRTTRGVAAAFLFLLAAGTSPHLVAQGSESVPLRQNHASLRSDATRVLQQQTADWLCALFPFLDSCQPDTKTVECPEVQPLNDTGFNLTLYIDHPWYVQKQQINAFQFEDDLFCMALDYQYNNEIGDDLINFVTFGNVGKVNGPSKEWFQTDGVLEKWCMGQDKNGGGYLRISPCLFAAFLERAGVPHWVIAVDQNNYTWAIVSGGKPDEVRYQDVNTTFCTTKQGYSSFDTSGSGLWLLTRDQNPGNQTVRAMESLLLDMGIFIGDLKYVNQTGCNYTNATFV